jgi:hypothetical protein
VSKSQQVHTVRSWIADWAFAVLWALLPIVSGPAFAEALAPRQPLFRTSVGAGLWVLWAVVLLSALIPRSITLTLVRISAPAAVLAAGWAAVATATPDWRDALALAVTTAAAVVAFTPALGHRFVNGSAYGPEIRFPLRAPGIVALGLGPAVWAVVVGGALAGPLLLVAEQWIAGVIALVVGWPVAWFGCRSLHRLAERWLVFVPAGLALVDPLTLTDAVSMPRGTIDTFGPAPADTKATDLTGGSWGLALEVAFDEPQTIVPLATGDEQPRDTEAGALLFTPTRPGHVLREARSRRLPVI